MTLDSRRRRGFLSDVIPDDFPLVTVLLLGVCVLFYFISVKYTADSTGESVMDPSGKALIVYGAMVPVLVQQGEWWRIFSSMVLHGGILHIAMNGIALWSLGREVEARFGRARALTVFVATGAIGMAFAYWLTPNVLLVTGASGALFGWMALIIAHAVRVHGGHFTHELRERFIPWILMSVIISFAPGVSLSAHLGGFLAGAGFGWFIGDKQVARRVPVVWQVAAFAAIAWLAAALVLATRSPFPALIPS